MPKSFIKIKPITASSEAHNTRKIKPKYLIIPSNENVHIGDERIKERRAKLEKIVKQKTGRSMQNRATPIREAVVLLPDDDNEFNIQALFKLTDLLKKNFGIDCFQWHIHNDEGYFNEEEQKFKYNYHAHLIFDWIDHNTGKSYKLDKYNLSEIQTITAEVLEMERGIKGSKSLSLNHHEFRGFLEIKDKLKKEMKKELTREQEHKIRKEIIHKRDADTRRKSKSFSR